MPRAGLTAERVVQEAAAVAEENGFDALTLSALAGRLGVRVPSLYKHVGGLGDLQQRLAVRAKQEVARLLARAAVGRSRGDALHAVAHAYRDWALAHPAAYAASLRAPDETDPADVAAAAEAVQVLYDVLAGYGLRDTDAVDATRTFRALLHGYVGLAAAGGFGLDRPVDDSLDWALDRLDAALRAGSTVPGRP